MLKYSIVIPIVQVCVGIYLIYLGRKRLEKSKNSKTWFSTIGNVISSNLEEHSGSNGSRTYGVDIKFKYQVNGKEYNSNKFNFAYLMTNNKQKHLDIVTRHQPNTKIKIFYDPANPEDAVIEQGSAPGAKLFIVIGCAFMLGGTFLILDLKSFLN
jgi:hypothetical protein